jgi:predicted MFS family arabinose efflux permease
VRNSAVWAIALGFALAAYLCFSIGWRVVTALVLGEPAVVILAALLALPAGIAGAGMALWRRRPAVARGLAFGVLLFWGVAGIHMLVISYAMSRIALAGLER